MDVVGAPAVNHEADVSTAYSHAADMSVAVARRTRRRQGSRIGGDAEVDAYFGLGLTMQKRCSFRPRRWWLRRDRTVSVGVIFGLSKFRRLVFLLRGPGVGDGGYSRLRRRPSLIIEQIFLTPVGAVAERAVVSRHKQVPRVEDPEDAGSCKSPYRREQ
eukprot:2622169-Pleurochrysis_carterae.AAC.6